MAISRIRAIVFRFSGGSNFSRLEKKWGSLSVEKVSPFWRERGEGRLGKRKSDRSILVIRELLRCRG